MRIVAAFAIVGLILIVPQSAGAQPLNGDTVTVEDQCLGRITVGYLTSYLDQAYGSGAGCNQMKIEARVYGRFGNLVTTRRYFANNSFVGDAMGVEGKLLAGRNVMKNARACFRLAVNVGQWTCTDWVDNPNN